ncbi:hypothetical protein AURDEDRAFT_116997 [Auricularia subglabra TFB-10046 SS5]|nr:hypothetical protein AURDEDRAFT_116997 [Auricularia subglabra TFB-10046 SS5]
MRAVVQPAQPSALSRSLPTRRSVGRPNAGRGLLDGLGKTTVDALDGAAKVVDGAGNLVDGAVNVVDGAVNNLSDALKSWASADPGNGGNGASGGGDSGSHNGGGGSGASGSPTRQEPRPTASPPASGGGDAPRPPPPANSQGPPHESPTPSPSPTLAGASTQSTPPAGTPATAGSANAAGDPLASAPAGQAASSVHPVALQSGPAYSPTGGDASPTGPPAPALQGGTRKQGFPLAAAAAIGGVLGFVVVSAILWGLWYCLRKRRRRAARADPAPHYTRRMLSIASVSTVPLFISASEAGVPERRTDNPFSHPGDMQEDDPFDIASVWSASTRRSASTLSV